MPHAKITLMINLKDQAEGSGEIELQEDFDTAIDKWQPTNPASSALEFRSNMTYTKADGGRICVNPNAIYILEEMGD